MIRRLLFRNFRLIHPLDRWLKRRFTGAGKLVLGTMLAAALFGLDIRRTAAYQLFALALAALALAMAAAPTFRPRVRVTREFPRYGTVGEPLHYTARLVNLGRRPLRGLQMLEALAATAPTFEEFLRAREPGAARRNFFDRRVGYPRWAWLMRMRRGAEPVERRLPDLPAGASVEVEMRFEPLRRGYVRSEALTLMRPDPLGLFRACVRVGGPASVLVLPRRHPVRWPDLAGTRPRGAGDTSLAAATGASEEFVSLREYRPGDPMRHLHWKSWARLGEPVVKEFQREFHMRQALVLDTVVPAGGAETFEAAVSAAASFAGAAPASQGLVDLVLVAPGEHRFASGDGVARPDRLLEVLACVAPCTDTEFDALCRPVASACATLSGCVLVLLAWDEARRRLVASLRGLGVPLLALVVSDAQAAPALVPGPMADAPERLRVLRAGHLREDLAGLGVAGGAPAAGAMRGAA